MVAGVQFEDVRRTFFVARRSLLLLRCWVVVAAGTFRFDLSATNADEGSAAREVACAAGLGAEVPYTADSGIRPMDMGSTWFDVT